MDRPLLPEHLQLLLSDEPVLDVYSYGPWRVPDGLYEEIREHAVELNRDPAAEALAVELPATARLGIFEPVAEIVKIYPREINTPDCRSSSVGMPRYWRFPRPRPTSS